MSYLISGGLMEYKAIKDAEEAEVSVFLLFSPFAWSLIFFMWWVDIHFFFIKPCVIFRVRFRSVEPVKTRVPLLLLWIVLVFASEQRNKPPPTEEELAEKSRLYEESRVEMFAAIEKENAVNREKDLISKVEVSTSITRCYIRLCRHPATSCFL